MKLALLILGLCCAAHAAPVSLFDGKTLDGWEIPEAEKKWWRVEDGKIVGGSMEEEVPLNTFLSHKKPCANFDLRFKVKLTQKEGFANSGIQVRSLRGKDAHMSGYQVDAGIGYWGSIWDEHRRNKKIAVPVDEAALTAVVKDWDWNDYRILCEGPRIRTWINGVLAIDFTETDPQIPLTGLIGFQAHSGGKFLVEFKDVTIEELAGVPVIDPLSPDSEKSSFVLPEGYEIELVASEQQGVPKPITVSWDASGKMWTVTAVEYPVDANENQAQAEALYARGGKDKVLVFDTPYAPGPHTPRVFAEGLVIPLGVLPEENAALVQYGSEIRRYIDDDKDGKADRFETILEGFGIQDSHLFPHQFEHAPGGWVYVAQGLFNYSTVRRPGGKPFANGAKEIAYNQCKLARFRTDGSEFELLSAGPNNIWGFETDRDGEVFLQEANDIGIPVAEYLPGTHYATGSREKLRPYAPQIPGSFEKPMMGGTGLSGIAIANDRDTAFAANYGGRRTFYIANPITNRIQVITMSQDESGRPTYRKESDFMTTGDQNFRPIAVRFGSDGFLYVVDWYNKIISHNEVPRTHPERDKTRGRIWRIKPKGAASPAVPDLKAADSAALVAALDHPSALVSRFAWLELGKRRDASIVPVLTAIVKDAAASLPKRLNAFWALEEMGALDAALLTRCSADVSRYLRYEALRAAGDIASLSSGDFLKMIRTEETDFRVRSITVNSVRRRTGTTPEELAALVPWIAPASHGATVREKYETDFLRYQIRWAFETHPASASAVLKSDLPPEARALVILSLPAEQAAMELVGRLSTLGRALNAEEIGLLGSQLKLPAVSDAFSKMLSSEATRVATLRSLLSFDASAASDENLRRAVAGAASVLGAGDKDLVLALARKFRLGELVPVVTKLADSGAIPRANALKTLNEMGGVDPQNFEPFLADANPDIRREAVIGYSASSGAAGVPKIAALWANLPGVLRELSVDGMLRTEEGAAAFALAAASGRFKDMGTSSVERAVARLGMDHPAVQKLLASSEGLLMPVISLSGNPQESIPIDVTLKGAFTVESWVFLNAPADNTDSLLGKKGLADFNFFASRLILHAEGQNRIVASRPVAPGIWTHLALTRDETGKLRIFIDGEPDPAEGAPYLTELSGLNPGVAIANGGTSAKFLGYRIWNVDRTENEIRQNFKTFFAPGDKPVGLVLNLPAKDTPLTTMTADFPELSTPAETEAIAAKFTATKAKAEKSGDPANGRKLVETSCLICHQINGTGQKIGPDLSGAGAMGIDGLLRNILTPNEQMESGYYRHDVALKDGTLASGFLASENKQTLVLRQIGADDRAIPRNQIVSHKVSKRSLMPEGLIDGFTEQQVADLFAYLMSLK
jgi:putative membrane-bound dehydrogenase-like protein